MLLANTSCYATNTPVHVGYLHFNGTEKLVHEVTHKPATTKASTKESTLTSVIVE